MAPFTEEGAAGQEKPTYLSHHPADIRKSIYTHVYVSWKATRGVKLFSGNDGVSPKAVRVVCV